MGLLLFFILPEIIEKIFFIKVRFPLIISILIFSSILIIHTSKKRRILTYSMVIVFMVFIVIWGFLEDTINMQIVSYSLLFVYFSYISYYLYLDIMSSKKVTSSIVFGAFAGYFLIGVLFFFIFFLLNVNYPDTLNIDMSKNESDHHVLYFSFITLTTIGYGDYAPTSTLGQKFAILEGLIGQFYIAAVMATIVGKFLNTESKTSKK